MDYRLRVRRNGVRFYASSEFIRAHLRRFKGQINWSGQQSMT